MSIVSNEKLEEVFSLALEQRSEGYADLVSNSNAILYEMKKRNQWKTFSGPTIRETLLYNETGSYTRYTGGDFLAPSPAELFNDAEFTPRLGAVSVALTGEEILRNSGSNQIRDVMTEHISAAENELTDRFVEDLHSAGTADNQIGGLQLMIPTTTNSGTYGGISRGDNAVWRTSTYNVHDGLGGALAGVTQLTDATVRKVFNHVMHARSRGQRGPNLICCSTHHFNAYDLSLHAIQRINDETGLGKAGFTSMKYYGAGKSVDVVLEGGIGTSMPDDTTYFMDTDAIKWRYHKDRNFKKFGGKQMPINQDMVVQHIGFFGEMTLNNPLHTAKLYDATPAS